MSGGICVHMAGALCALHYCDYYDLELQKCSLAIESHARAEILLKLLDKMEELISNVKDEDAAFKLMRELNLILGPKTVQ